MAETDEPTASSAGALLEEILATGSIRSVFQPIVDLDGSSPGGADGPSVVGYEALARGPRGPLERPDMLFAAARAHGRLAALDEACRAAAFRAAAGHGLVAPLPVFVNVEPEVLDQAPLTDLLAVVDDVPGELRIVLELTERALATRPAELLRTVERVRELGWGVALDDVGAESASLAFMPLLRPDVVKLDLSLVQRRPTPAIAEIMNAVNAYAERTGALVLAEGIETEEHVKVARGLGASLGQGWLFGRPTETPTAQSDAGVLQFAPQAPIDLSTLVSPFAQLPPSANLRRAPKRLLVEVSKQLEREAMRLGEACVVAATFQHAEHFTAATAQRYRDLVARAGFVCALGQELPGDGVPGLRGAELAPQDPLCGEWDLAVVGPHFAVALLARDLGDTGPDAERMFEYAVTYDRDSVVAAAHGLLSRVAPRDSRARIHGGSTAPALGAPAPAGSRGSTRGSTRTAQRFDRTGDGAADDMLRRALAATTNGVTIADMTKPDQPLVFVNAAFEALTGLSEDQLLGRNCRFLQGPDSDRSAVARIRDAIAQGRECKETLLNFRGQDRTPWWNEVHLSPVHDDAGRLVEYIGVQNDVTARVEAERALAQARDRTRHYLARIEQLAWTDPLTGLMNRRKLEERVESALWEARADGDGLALLFIDLDGFKTINDTLGHAAGDEVLQEVAARLSGRVRRTDLLARLGGDEFLVAMTGLDPETAGAEAQAVADQLAVTVASPIPVAGGEVTVRVSIGISTYPDDGEEFGGMLHLADSRMYALKGPRS